MQAWERMGCESTREYALDRYGGEDEPEAVGDTGTCADCERWHRCELDGHEQVGWCAEWADFTLEDDGCED
jgi:hypothetical protein